MKMKDKLKKMDKLMEEKFKDKDEVVQFETDAEILQELGYDLTADDLKLINQLGYVIDKKVSSRESSEMMYQ